MAAGLSSRLVFAVWAAMTLAALGFVWAFGVNVPWEDDWMMVPALCGEWPLKTWLWMQQNEHRLPVTRLIHLALARATGFDSRSGMVLNVALLSALAFGLMRVAARRRGHAEWTDVIFPVALLHLGHWWTLLMNMQVFVASVTVLLGFLLMFAHAEGWRDRRWRTGLMAVTLLLPLHGANGVLLVPVAVGLLAMSAIHLRHSEATRAHGEVAVLVAGGVASVVIAGLYFAGWHGSAYASPRLGPVVRTAGQWVSMSFGLAPRGVWPLLAAFAGTMGVWAAIRVIAAIAAAGPLRPRAVAYGCCLLGIALQTAAVGFGRAGMGDDPGLAVRFVTHTCMIPLALCLALEGLGTSRAPRVALCSVVLALLPFETWQGLRGGIARRETLQAVERDIAAGLSEAEIAERHWQRIFPWSEEHVRLTLASLRREGLGPYRGVTVKPASPE